jgi:hypothetical protein
MPESKIIRVCFGAALLVCAISGGHATTAQQTPQSAASIYRVGPLDTLQIIVSKHPELSVDAVVVRPDGYIRLPIFHEEQAIGLGTNDVRAAGLSTGELSRVLSHKIEHETIVVVKQKASQRPAADTGTSTLKKRIPPANPAKYLSVADAHEWQNPYLIVRAQGIDVRPINGATETRTMSPAEVTAYLEKLPSIAWPYGSVVAVQESGLRAPGDDAQIKRNREELVRLLEKAGVKFELWPSA